MAYNIEARVHVFKSGGERVTSKFGPRTIFINGAYNTNNHSGIDLISRTLGSDYIVAFARGLVTETRNTVAGFSESQASGNYVRLKHDGGYTTEYFHMKKGSVAVQKGQTVERGQVLGYMGATGWVNGAHLHFGVRLNGTAKDPEPYLLGEKAISGYTEGNTVSDSGAVMLANVPLYVSSTAATPSNRITGLYYLWGPEIIKGRCRITNKPDRVGVVGQVTGWVDAVELTATAEAIAPSEQEPQPEPQPELQPELQPEPEPVTESMAELTMLRAAVDAVKVAVANL